MNEDSKVCDPAAGSDGGLLSRYRLDLGLALALVILAGGLRVWQIANTSISSRDSIAFVHYAWLLENRPWPDVMASAPHHPGYPLAVLATARLLRPCCDGPEAVFMQWSAQITSAAISILLVIPVYAVGRIWFGRATGFAAAALMQLLPASSLVLADGLSEGLLLLWAACAVWAASVGLSRRAPLPLAACGFCSGVAYLVRPEGAIVAAATGLVLAGMQCRARSRQSWRRFLVCGVSLAVPAALTALPLVLITGRLTTKPTADGLLPVGSDRLDVKAFGRAYHWRQPDLQRLLAQVSPELVVPGSGPRPAGAPFRDSRRGHAWAALGQLGAELLEALAYILWLPVLIGLWCRGDAWQRAPGTWVAACTAMIVLGAMWRIASVHGYVSGRHLLLALLGCSWWAAAGLVAAAERLTVRFPKLGVRVGQKGLLAALLLLVIAPGMPKILESPHADRVDHRAAGLWLAANADVADTIVDPHAWAAYYAGRAFRDDNLGPWRGDVYVVLRQTDRRQSQLPTYGQAMRLAASGQVVFRTAHDDGAVVISRVSRTRQR